MTGARPGAGADPVDAQLRAEIAQERRVLGSQGCLETACHRHVYDLRGRPSLVLPPSCRAGQRRRSRRMPSRRRRSAGVNWSSAPRSEPRAYSSARIERLTTDQKVAGSNPAGRATSPGHQRAVGTPCEPRCQRRNSNGSWPRRRSRRLLSSTFAPTATATSRTTTTPATAMPPGPDVPPLVGVSGSTSAVRGVVVDVGVAAPVGVSVGARVSVGVGAGVGVGVGDGVGVGVAVGAAVGVAVGGPTTVNAEDALAPLLARVWTEAVGK